MQVAAAEADCQSRLSLTQSEQLRKNVQLLTDGLEAAKKEILKVIYQWEVSMYMQVLLNFHSISCD